jgi:hypothetical protein
VYFDNKIDNLIQWGAARRTGPTCHPDFRSPHQGLGRSLAPSAQGSHRQPRPGRPRNEATDKLLARRARETGVWRDGSFGALTVGSEVFGSGKRFDDAANTAGSAATAR